MSRVIKNQLFPNVTKTVDPIFDNGNNSSALPKEEATTSFFFISDYMYGGCLTFTAFDATSKILKKAKFMIDLSFLPNDGGGTQYTFLDALYHNCVIILNRQWIENVDAEYRDFKEGENCYAVSNAEELRELLDNAENIDTAKIVQNARKLLDKHIHNASDWYKESHPCSVPEFLSN